LHNNCSLYWKRSFLIPVSFERERERERELLKLSLPLSCCHKPHIERERERERERENTLKPYNKMEKVSGELASKFRV
jgi:hypothetical protein